VNSEFVAGKHDAITDVGGIRVGHWTDRRGATGCTAILYPGGALAAVDVRGGAPGSRETDVLGSQNLVRTVHGVLFTGGSAFGLAAADGVMRWLGERGAGFESVHRRVPIVPAAVIYDLGLGNPNAAPGPEAGYSAARRARGGNVAQGSVGAGTGATVAKLLGGDRAIKGGVGTASILGPRGCTVGAIVVCNAIGNVIDPADGSTLAAPRGEPGQFLSLREALAMRTAENEALAVRANTTLICVATDAVIEHSRLQRLAIQAHDGLARTVLPAHTFGDGDIAFALSTSRVPIEPPDLLELGLVVVLAVETALLKGVRLAHGLHGVPSAAEWRAATV
jgi:L-aminopeptidase/D-esterase-like protein